MNKKKSYKSHESWFRKTSQRDGILVKTPINSTFCAVGTKYVKGNIAYLTARIVAGMSFFYQYLNP